MFAIKTYKLFVPYPQDNYSAQSMQLKSFVFPLLALVSLVAANPLGMAAYGDGDIDSLDAEYQLGAEPMIYDTEYTEESTAYASPRRGPVTIVPVKGANKCLDVRGANFQNGTPVQIYDCNGTNAQKWLIQRSGHIRVSGTNFCLDAGHAPRTGVGLKIWTCIDNLRAQAWRYGANKTIKLRAANLNQCVDLSGGSLANGQQTQTWNCERRHPNQMWRLRA
ncbi:hypothetical protein D9619_004901 [Psilocybe cf. subviscida]|uniref:Ricin B lectin domain-containing protein n=1 Tax=Psilocybe cf. subviscida TaxID=2480587 RepID=A0A8H5BRA5_9AGAR|nr:hypothetical protein D9619_004901 [Psilocybe cf. subviscida]